MKIDENLKGHFGAILADPPWHWAPWAMPAPDSPSYVRHACAHYETMPLDQIKAMPVKDFAAKDCALFLWFVWPMLPHALEVIDAWGFTFKTCAFCWTKADARQVDMFEPDTPVVIGPGYWTRSNTEACLLATTGRPKRQANDVRQAIIAPRRQHSRKPDEIAGRIERLVRGPYLELFARTRRAGWTAWGNETDKFGTAAANQ